MNHNIAYLGLKFNSGINLRNSVKGKHVVSIVSLLFVTTLFLSCFASVFSANIQPFASAASYDYPVSNESDLVAAVAAAITSGDTYTIYFEDDIYLTDTLNVPSGASAVVIRNKSGTGPWTLYGANGKAVITVNGANFKLNDITVTHKDYESGRGVRVTSGTLTLDDGGTISNNYVDPGSNGGGVYVVAGTFNMPGGTISNNNATYGGGVYIESGASNSIMMSGNAQIFNNRAYEHGGGVYINSAFTLAGGEIFANTATLDGGGVFVSVHGDFRMTGGVIGGGSSVGANTADFGGGVANIGVFDMRGGMIYYNSAVYGGGGVGNSIGGAFTMSDNAKISYNSAVGGSTGTTGLGGGVYNSGNFAFTSYTSGLYGVISNNDAIFGGGVFNYASFEIKVGEISDNTAEYGGGVYNYGIFKMVVPGGLISGNAAELGGGVYNANDFELVDGEISDNQAFDATHMNGGGGGVYNNGDRFVMSGGKILDNDSKNGGGVYNDQRVFAMSGGEISGNTAFNANGEGYGGGVYSDYIFGLSSTGLISGNDAEYGGGVYNNGHFVMTGGEISGNTVTENAGGVFSGNSTNNALFQLYGTGLISSNEAKYGGGVYSVDDFLMTAGTVSSNTATAWGGGVYNAGYFELSGTGTVSGNEAAFGGGVISDGATAQFNMTGGSTIFGNEASVSGGGVYVSSSTFNMTGGSTIFGNEASVSGGGVYVNNGNFNMTGNSEVYGNEASVSGGGVYVNNGGLFNMTGSGNMISGNQAVNGGGVYVANDGFFNVTNGVLSNNKALSGRGGGVWITGSPVDSADFSKLYVASSVVFSGNTASAQYYIEPIHVTLYDEYIKGTVWSNAATNGYNNLDISYGNTYYIIYNANGGSGTMSNVATSYNWSVTVAANGFSRSGYAFAGWNTQAAGAGGSYTAGQTFTYNPYDAATGSYYDAAKNFNLYAQWTIIPVVIIDGFSVTYNGNGATSGSTPSNTNVYNAGASVSVAANPGGLVKSGYTFLGWAYSNSAVTPAFAVSGNSVSPDSFIINNDVTLYAVWEVINYTVTYQPGAHGTFTAQVTPGLHYGALTPAAPTVTGETGWTFTGWSPTPTTTVTGSTTYTAQWTQTTTPTPSTTPSSTQEPSTSTTPSPTATSTTVATPSVTTPGEDPRIKDNEAKWAVVNLVVSVLGVVLVVVLALFVVFGRKQVLRGGQGVGKGEQGSDGRYFWRLNAAAAVNDNDGVDLASSQFGGRWFWWLVVAVVLAVVGVVVFLFTEDMGLVRGWVDKWTVVNAIVFVVELVIVYLCLREFKPKTTQEKPIISTKPSSKSSK